MNRPQTPGWYWYNGDWGWEIVFVEKKKFLYVRTLNKHTQTGVPLSCVRGTWGSEVKRGE